MLLNTPKTYDLGFGEVIEIDGARFNFTVILVAEPSFPAGSVALTEIVSVPPERVIEPRE